MVALMGGTTLFGATAVSADGRSVFGSELGPDGTHVVRWDENGKITRYAQPFEASGSYPAAVTPDGSVLVGNYQVLIGREYLYRAVAWLSPTHIIALGSLHGGSSSRALGVSADGTVIVGDATDGVTNKRTMFRWTAATGMQSIEEWLPGAGENAAETLKVIGPAYGVSADGSRVVGRLLNGNGFVASAGGMPSGH
jgi:uncharacterized membrane protein